MTAGIGRAKRAVGTIRVIGIGNALAGDDAVGVLAARRLRDLADAGADVEIIEADMAGLDVLDLMEGAKTVILIDAARSGQPAGTIHRLDASAAPVATPLFSHSTHALNVVEALELARTLGRLPPQVIVYGIEAGAPAFGQALSPIVVRAMAEVTQQILRDIEASRHA